MNVFDSPHSYNFWRELKKKYKLSANELRELQMAFTAEILSTDDIEAVARKLGQGEPSLLRGNRTAMLGKLKVDIDKK